MKALKKFGTLRIAAGLAFIIAAVWFAVTCAVHAPQSPSAVSKIVEESAGTPLPAMPIGEMATPPSAGEPPVGVFTDEQLDQMDKLPVGSAPPAGETP